MLALWIILMLLLLLVGLTIAAPYDPWTLNSSRVGCLTSLRLHLSAVSPNKDTHTHTHSLTRDKTNKYILPALTCMWYLTIKTNSCDFLMPVETVSVTHILNWRGNSIINTFYDAHQHPTTDNTAPSKLWHDGRYFTATWSLLSSKMMWAGAVCDCVWGDFVAVRGDNSLFQPLHWLRCLLCNCGFLITNTTQPLHLVNCIVKLKCFENDLWKVWISEVFGSMLLHREVVSHVFTLQKREKIWYNDILIPHCQSAVRNCLCRTKKGQFITVLDFLFLLKWLQIYFLHSSDDRFVISGECGNIHMALKPSCWIVRVIEERSGMCGRFEQPNITEIVPFSLVICSI